MFTWLAIFITSWIATSIPQIMLWELMYPIASSLHLVRLARQLYLPLAYIMLTIIHAVLGPIFPIASTLFYYDQRMRREGYDIERLMDAAGLHAPPAPPAETAQASEEEALP
jgi:hypothetical protein